MWPICSILTEGDSPVSLDTVKAHLRLLHSDDDANLEMHLAAVVSQIEERTGRHLRTRTAQLTVCGFPYGDEPLALPFPPLVDVTAVTYFNAGNVSTSLATFRKFLGSTPGHIRPAVDSDWPDTYDRNDAVTVSFSTGYSSLPQTLTAAVLLGVELAYSELPWLESRRIEERFDALVRNWIVRDQRVRTQ